jgi:murein L,D-transpeptidase YafK
VGNANNKNKVTRQMKIIIKAGLSLITIMLCVLPLQSNPSQDKTILKADKICVHKEKRILQLIKDNKVIKEYKISLGFEPVGHKQKEGDGKTPEGIYKITQHHYNSQYHTALRISYPNQIDKENAKKLGANPGGDIMLHGLGKKFSWMGKTHTFHNWTLGCVAVTNSEIDEIAAAVTDGSNIEIYP